MSKITAEDIVNFWFMEVGEQKWFKPAPELDQEITKRFTPLYEQAASGQLKEWEETPSGMLALLLLLDQFPRNMFRNTAKAFATDDLALDLARTSIIKHFDDRIDVNFKLFFYLPFEHSENMGDQRLALFYVRERTKNPEWLEWAERHFNTIQQFGRFPHRNEALGRQSTAAEEAFLKNGGGF
ncbi:MAG: DUF924 family protein [Alphaproteobacteria bacterium]|nr:DUF924 family protein [Alphaproteobacteria bacterium]